MNLTQMPSDLSSTIDPIIIEAMETMWGRSPRPFQLDAIHRLCYPKHFQVPPSVLLVQGTASGKITVMQMMALSIHCGVALDIMTLLALASDQESKVAITPQDAGPVLSYHLDEFHQQEDMGDQNQLLQMWYGTNTSVHIFASPQCLLRSGSPRLDLLIHLYKQQLLNLMCIDEAHLFLEFGQSFRQEFWLLSD